MSSTALPATPVSVDLGAIRALVGPDMQAVDACIHQHLDSEVVLIRQIGTYITGLGGKRLRPLVVLLAARAAGYEGQQHVQLAAIVEFIHTATLLHDDVVDESDRRRGESTANGVWGNAASVLVGDFLYSRSFQLMVALERMRVMQILADTTNTIAEGEVMQLLNHNSPDTSEERHLEVARCKTAKLFESAAQLGAVLAGGPASHEKALAEYGLNLGMAFQLIDDVLDFSGDGETLGKNAGDDLAEGNPTLPLIHAMRTGTPSQVSLVRDAIEGSRGDRFAEVRAIVESTGSLAYTSALARDFSTRARDALADLPASSYRKALEELAEFAIERPS
ncbi:MAG: polyprenyl synthetase family protein [Gammaproteobacteria bacterium]|nr:polyprenyl synthetase family protein [Gammaproteobacteria bacterium]